MIRIISTFIVVIAAHFVCTANALSANLSEITISPFTAHYYSEDDGKEAGKGNDGTNKSVVSSHLFSETVTRPALNLTFPFHGIDSYNFFGVWEGTMHVAGDKRSAKANFDVSWSDVSFYVNDQLVEKWANDSKTVQFNLNKGDNTVRIELHNHWHTTSFNVSFTDYQKLDNVEALELFRNIDFSSTKAVYLGAYEANTHTADNNSNELLVTLPKSSTPIFLFLNSFRAVNWVINNPHKAPIAGIVLRGRSPGSTVALGSPVHVYELPAGKNSYKSSYDIRTYIGRYADYAFTEYSLSTIIVPDFFKDTAEDSPENNYPINAFSESLVVQQQNDTVTKTQMVKEPALAGSFIQSSWKGYVDVAEKIDKSFKISHQNILAELVIDGRSVWRGKKNGEQIYQHSFESGKHEVMFVAYPEVEYNPVKFNVSITDNARDLKYDELATILRELGDFDPIYCGVQNSTVEDQTVDIIENDTKKPVVLFLTSFHQVIWDFEYYNTDKLAAVVTSAKNSSEFIKNLPPQIPVYHFFNLSNTIHLTPARGLRNINNTFKKAALQIFSLTGKLPTGFSGAKQAKTITVPEIVLEREQYLNLGLADVSPDYNIFLEYPEKIDIVFNPVPTRYIDYSSRSTPKRTKKFEPEVQRNSWAEPLGATEDIPTGEFKAYYFDIFNPGQPKFSGIVDEAFVESTGKTRRNSTGNALVDEYGIIPENFGAFWIGNITLKKDNEMTINIDSGNASTRLLIDDKVVKNRKISLKKGLHKIEIEHVNNWHTYGFSFSITRDSKILLAFEKFKKQVIHILPRNLSWNDLQDRFSEFLRKI